MTHNCPIARLRNENCVCVCVCVCVSVCLVAVNFCMLKLLKYCIQVPVSHDLFHSWKKDTEFLSKSQIQASSNLFRSGPEPCAKYRPASFKAACGNGRKLLGCLLVEPIPNVLSLNVHSPSASVHQKKLPATLLPKRTRPSHLQRKGRLLSFQMTLAERLLAAT